MQLYEKYGRPFNYRTAQDAAYSTIEYGHHYNKLCIPSIDEHAFYDVFLIICSSSTEFDRRAKIRIRMTKLLEQFNVGYLFVLGSNVEVDHRIRRENREFQDILQLGHVDCYHHITLSVFGALQFLAAYTGITNYFLKTDSDCIYNLQRIIQTVQHTKRPYIGNCRFSDYYITTKRYLKMFVPESLVQKDLRIPPYATGAGYLIRSAILPQLMIAIRHLNFIGHNEDVNIGKAFNLLNRNCTFESDWVARKGCFSVGECRKYAILHKNVSEEEVDRMWYYITKRF